MSTTRRLARDRIFDRSGAVSPPPWRDQLADIGAIHVIVKRLAQRLP